MLLVSFCDIVTITICAMFMAMIVVIDESSKIPVIVPVPVLRPTTNAPVYFECRDKMVFPIDLPSLLQTFAKYTNDYKKGGGATDIEKLMSLDVGNDFYRLDPGLATMGFLGLQPRAGAKGTPLSAMLASPTNTFTLSLLNIHTNSQYCVFFVRDSGFNVFRMCRDLAVKRGFHHGWEYVSRDEPITFEGLMKTPGTE